MTETGGDLEGPYSFSAWTKDSGAARVSREAAMAKLFATDQAQVIHEQLAEQGILTRLFIDQPRIRFGLPGNERAWQRLQQALARLNTHRPIALEQSS